MSRHPLKGWAHLLTEVELTFPTWAAVYVLSLVCFEGPARAAGFLMTRGFHEPLFIAGVMIVGSSGPVLRLVDRIMFTVARLLPLNRNIAEYVTVLIVALVFWFVQATKGI